MLVNNSAEGPDGDVINVSEENVIELIAEINSKKFSNSTVKEFILNCLVKLSTRFGNNAKQKIGKMIESEKTSYFSEVQQRAVEYAVFNEKIDDNIKQKVAFNVPNFKSYGEENSEK